MSELLNTLKALGIANKRIDELEKENAKLIQAGCDLCFYAVFTEEYRLAREKFPCRKVLSGGDL